LPSRPMGKLRGMAQPIEGALDLEKQGHGEKDVEDPAPKPFYAVDSDPAADHTNLEDDDSAEAEN
jgi:hypothetical protein